MLPLQISVSILNAVLLTFLALKYAHMMQLGGYRYRALFNFLLDKRQVYTLRLFALSLLGFGAAFILRMFVNGLFLGLGLLLYFGLGLFLILHLRRSKSKVPLKMTARVWRLLCVTFVLSYAATFGISLFLSRSGLTPTGMVFIPCLATVLPVIVLAASVIVWPYEWIVRRVYLARARRKLFSPQYKDLIRIGITGSYGKTTCKNILTQMLEKKYSVAASPSSFNTPMGFCRTVNEVLKPEHQILIMEMGARYKGDIKFMTKLFRPHHGILTAIGSAHLETFKTLQNICSEKYQLINSLPPDGIRVVGGEKPDNIAMCTEMAKKLGVSDQQIAEAVAELKPTPHRLEHIVTEHGVNILDDSYNANPDSVKMALEQLQSIACESAKKSRADIHKIILTPGMVELGKHGKCENFKFGVHMARVADKVIIVNELNKQMLHDGLIAGGFSEENIFYARTLDDAKKLYSAGGKITLKSGDVLLIENDLPDNFI